MTCPHDFAPCPRGDCYYDVKLRAGLIAAEALTSGGLSEEERTYVGLTGVIPPTDGWHAPSTPPPPPSLLEVSLDRVRHAEDRPILRYMLSPATAQALR